MALQRNSPRSGSSAGCTGARFLNYGGANAMPTPAENAAVLRHWQHRYGAVMLAFDHKFEMFVEHPPHTRPDALQLTYEYALYCED